MSTAIMSESEAQVKTSDAAVSIYLEADPHSVLAEAHRAAVALKQVLDGKTKKLVFNERRYLESEDWVTLGRFYGITGAAIGDPEFVTFPGDVGELAIRGFKASFVALREGREISRATAYCLTDEEKWGSRPKYEWHYVKQSGGTSAEDPGKDELVWEFVEAKGKNLPKKVRVLAGEERVPLYQMASMAQTRAMSKVLAQVLKWVVVLAGYAPTPAEEMTDIPGVVDAEPVTSRPATSRREPGDEDPEEMERAAYDAHGVEPPTRSARAARPAQRSASGPTGPNCEHCGKPSKPSKYPKPGREFYCYDCKAQLDKDGNAAAER